MSPSPSAADRLEQLLAAPVLGPWRPVSGPPYPVAPPAPSSAAAASPGLAGRRLAPDRVPGPSAPRVGRPASTAPPAGVVTEQRSTPPIRPGVVWQERRPRAQSRPAPPARRAS